MPLLLFVALGGAMGSAGRYLTGQWAGRLLGSSWPYGTFTVNIVGGFFMGLLAGWLAHRGDADQEHWRVLLGVGVLGGFTTFSAYTLELALMIERRAYGAAAIYGAGSVFVALAALYAGLILARAVFA
jgi:CrcB protein